MLFNDLFESDREPYQQAIDRVEMAHINTLNAKMDEIIGRVNREKLTAEHKALLKKEYVRLKAERDSIYGIKDGTPEFTVECDSEGNASVIDRIGQAIAQFTQKKYGSTAFDAATAYAGTRFKSANINDIAGWENAAPRKTGPVRLRPVIKQKQNAEVVVSEWRNTAPGADEEQRKLKKVGIVRRKAEADKTEAKEEIDEEYKPVTRPVPQPKKLNPGWALDPTTKAELKRRKDVRNRVGVDEDNKELSPGEQMDAIMAKISRERITDPDVLALLMKKYNLLKQQAQSVDEGWSERALAQRTGQPQTPYGVYIDGKQWKEFPTDDQARAVARKLEAKFAADGSNKKVSYSPAQSYLDSMKESAVLGIEEDLKKWFKQKWVRFGPDGKIRGDCARGSESEGKPKCLPQSKAHSLGKKGRAKSGAKKRRNDPDANRTGKAKNVATKVQEDGLDEACWKGYHKDGMKTMFGKRYPNCVKNKNESLEIYVDRGECPGCGGTMVAEDQINEKQDACYHKVKSRYKVWPSAYASGALVQCRKKGAANWGNKSESVEEADLDEEWSAKYKSSINCSNPKGFSQKAHCAAKNEGTMNQSAHNPSGAKFGGYYKGTQVGAPRPGQGFGAESKNFMEWAVAQGARFANFAGNPEVYSQARTAYLREGIAGGIPKISKIPTGAMISNAKIPAPTLKTKQRERQARAAKFNEQAEAEAELKPGQYYVWEVSFDDGTKSRVKVTSDQFDPKAYYAKKNRVVIKTDYNWTIHG